MRSAPLLTTFALALAVAGCGGASNAAHTSPAPGVSVTTPATSPATTETATLTQTTTTAASTTTATQGPPACTASDLRPLVLGQNGAAGHAALGVGLRNVGTVTCHTYGFPGVQLLNGSGSSVGPAAQRTTDDLVGHAPKVAITLSPGQEASFRLITSDVSSGGGGCPTASAVQIFAPDDTAAMKLQIRSIESCGTPTVTPLEPGASANPGG